MINFLHVAFPSTSLILWSTPHTPKKRKKKHKVKSDRFYFLWKNDMISQHTQNLQKLQNTLNYIYFLKTWLERSFSDFDVSNKKKCGGDRNRWEREKLFSHEKQSWWRFLHWNQIILYFNRFRMNKKWKVKECEKSFKKKESMSQQPPARVLNFSILFVMLYEIFQSKTFWFLFFLLCFESTSHAPCPRKLKTQAWLTVLA